MGEDIEMNATEKKELALSKIILIVLAVAGLIAVAWFAWILPGRQANKVNSYQACVDEGNPIMDSYPTQCRSKSGKLFTNPGQKVQQSPY